MDGLTDVIYHAAERTSMESARRAKMIGGMWTWKKIKKKYEEGIDTGKYPKQDEVSDPALVDDENTVTSTPIDRVSSTVFSARRQFRAMSAERGS
jgi:hypothetical protein